LIKIHLNLDLSDLLNMCFDWWK